MLIQGITVLASPLIFLKSCHSYLKSEWAASTKKFELKAMRII